MAGAFAHPLAAGALIVLLIVLVLDLGGWSGWTPASLDRVLGRGRALTRGGRGAVRRRGAEGPATFSACRHRRLIGRSSRAAELRAMLKSIAKLEPVGDGMRQVIEIVVSDGYHPAHIEARAGVPIRLVFQRRDDHACTDRVVFSEPRLERRLAPYATTIVDLPPAGGCEIRFTCGMGQYRGRIELLSPQASGTGTRIRALAALACIAIVAVAAAAWLAMLAGATNPGRAVLAAAAVAAVLGIPIARRLGALRPHHRP